MAVQILKGKLGGFLPSKFFLSIAQSKVASAVWPGAGYTSFPATPEIATPKEFLLNLRSKSLTSWPELFVTLMFTFRVLPSLKKAASTVRFPSFTLSRGVFANWKGTLSCSPKASQPPVAAGTSCCTCCCCYSGWAKPKSKPSSVFG